MVGLAPPRQLSFGHEGCRVSPAFAKRAPVQALPGGVSPAATAEELRPSLAHPTAERAARRQRVCARVVRSEDASGVLSKTYPAPGNLEAALLHLGGHWNH